jgi:hypothetical protein
MLTTGKVNRAKAIQLRKSQDNKKRIAESEVLPAVSIWAVYIITRMMATVRTSETLVTLYQSTWRYNPEDSHLQEQNII